MIPDELKEKIRIWLKRNWYAPYELYADYNDYIDDKHIAEFLRAENPRHAFEDYMSNLDKYCDGGYYHPEAFWNAEDDIVKECRKHFKISKDVDDEELRDALWDCGMGITADFDHFLAQDVYVDIFLTNDEEENYEYNLNTMYPFYDSWAYSNEQEDEKISDINNNASLLWLAKTQGYGKRQFFNFMHGRKNAVESKFFSSVYEELQNKYTSISQLVFLQRYTLNELLDIATNKEAIEIPVGTMCGLFDDWNGEGSILGIELEKPVKVPYGRYIIRPDESYKYSVGDVYGLCADAWKEAA